MSDILFVIAVPFIVCAGFLGFFYLGRALAKWALFLWNQLRKKER